MTESEKSPSAFVLSQAEIENELRKRGSGFQDGKQRIIELYQTQMTWRTGSCPPSPSRRRKS